MSTIFEQVKSETAERIVAAAKARGLSVDEYLAGESGSGENGYDSIAPKRSYTVSVRYQFKGRGEALPYPPG